MKFDISKPYFQNQYLPFLLLGELLVSLPGPPHKFLQAQYLAVSLFVAVSQLCLALKDFLAASE